MRAGTLLGGAAGGRGDAVRREAGPGAGLISVLRLPLEFTSNEQKVLNSACAAPCPSCEARSVGLASPSTTAGTAQVLGTAQ